jgi:hypothetical protein
MEKARLAQAMTALTLRDGKWKRPFRQALSQECSA